MNAVMALCHFCEVHGPTVVICTQPYGRKYSGDHRPLTVIDKATSDEVKNYIHSDKLFHLYEKASQNNTSCVPRQQPCPACTSVGKDGVPFISTDHSTGVSYMSSQSPEDNALFTLLRHACIRSLTCEITPGEEGAIYFGEESNGHVLSYRFKLQNALARGLKSTYSVVILSKDKLFLLNLWPFVVPNLKIMVNTLQEDSQAVYAEEQAMENTRSVRLGNPDLHPALSHRSRTGDMEPRSLINITRDDKIFYRIHAWFTWFLRVSDQVFTEWNPMIIDSGELSIDSSGDNLVDVDMERQMNNLIQLYHLLGRQEFETLAFHTVVGNQIIVRSPSESLSSAISEAISMLLPKGCVSRGYSEVSYCPLFQYNLLALHINIPLPQEVTSVDGDPCVVVVANFINPQLTEFNRNSNLSPDVISIRMNSSKPPLVSSISSSIPSFIPPKIVCQYLEILDNPIQVSSELLASNIDIARCEWLNKAQLFYTFKRKQTSCRLSDNECEQRLSTFLKAIGISTVADHAVVRFWVKGLPEESKKVITSKLHNFDYKKSIE